MCRGAIYVSAPGHKPGKFIGFGVSEESAGTPSFRMPSETGVILPWTIHQLTGITVPEGWDVPWRRISNRHTEGGNES